MRLKNNRKKCGLRNAPLWWRRLITHYFSSTALRKRRSTIMRSKHIIIIILWRCKQETSRDSVCSAFVSVFVYFIMMYYVALHLLRVGISSPRRIAKAKNYIVYIRMPKVGHVIQCVSCTSTRFEGSKSRVRKAHVQYMLDWPEMCTHCSWSDYRINMKKVVKSCLFCGKSNILVR